MGKQDADSSLPALSTLVGHISSEAAKRMVILSGLKTTISKTDVEKLAGSAKRVRQLHFPVACDSGDATPSAAILYRGKRDALKAVTRLNSCKLDGTTLNAMLYGSKPTKPSNVKRGRLIVRNLSFKCEADDLTKAFSQFGEVAEVIIPVQANGKKKGFGIVQFKSAVHAGEAIKQMNGTSLMGRPVAVDWMVAKDRYLKAVEAEETPMDDENGSDIHSEEEKDADGEKSDDDDDDSPMDDSDDESDDDDDMTEDDEEENDESEDETKTDTKRKTKPKPPRKPDVDQGQTVFVRNLSFDTMEEDLEEFMSQFGDVAYCRLVVDPDTEHPKGVVTKEFFSPMFDVLGLCETGTAFVKFKSKDSVEKCLTAAEDEKAGLHLDGRKLNVSLALSRDKVQEIASQKKTKEKVDQRNLHLIRESLVRPGTKAAEGLSKGDIAKRLKVESIMRQKLKNPNIFVSTTRLCVRNIPTSVDDRALKKVFLKAADNPQAKITECRIMRDLTRIGASKLGKSRGYAFVNFACHEDALKALRNTNNNPEIFGEKKRLIVEFSLENKSALLAKEQRAQRAQVRHNMFGSEKPVRYAPKTKLKVDTVAGDKSKNKGSLVLPSHSGPKVRHKRRAAPVSAPKTPKDSVVVQEPKKKKKKTGRRRKNVEIRDDVDQLVAKYRQKISASSGGSKWTF